MIFGIILIIIFIFGVVVFFGAPYLPTMEKQTQAALDLLKLRPGQTLIELGSGDGRVMRAAAKRGLKAVGYELNPFLVVVSYVVTWKYRKNVQIIWGNYWRKAWPKADGIFVFLIDSYMEKLDKKLTNYPYKPIKLASFTFEIPSKKPEKTIESIHIYRYK